MEVPRDIAFTIEYSARTAWEAIHVLLGRGPAPPPVYQGQFDPPVRIETWCRASYADLAGAARCRVEGVHLWLTISALHLRAWNKDAAWVLRTLPRMIDEAHAGFAYVSVGAQDAKEAIAKNISI